MYQVILPAGKIKTYTFYSTNGKKVDGKIKKLKRTEKGILYEIESTETLGICEFRVGKKFFWLSYV